MPGCIKFYAAYGAMLALQEEKIAGSGPCQEARVRIGFLTRFAQLEEKISRALMSNPNAKECFRPWNATLLKVRGARSDQERSLSYATAACHVEREEEQSNPTAGQ